MFSGRLAVVAVLATAPVTASVSAEESTGVTEHARRIRVAVAFEGEPQLSFPPEFGPHAATRALAQGIREACLPVHEPAAAAPPTCAEVGDAPGSRVCVDETAARALAREIDCSSTDASAEAIELAGSTCESTDCFQSEARRAGATHLLLVTGTWRDGFAVSGTMESLAGAGRTPVGPGPDYNPQRPRTGPQVLAILKWVARDAVADELRRDRQRVAAIVTPAPPPVVAAPAVSPPPAATPESRGHKAIGWTLIGAGVGAGAASGWLFAIDKRGTDCAALPSDPEPCSKVRRTLIPAIGLGVGAAAALVGGLVLVLAREGTAAGPVAITARPDGFALGGTF
jgi:hypothetical protein